MKKLSPFKNEPFQDFSKKPVADKLRAALKSVRASFGREYPLIIGGREMRSDQKIVSINPSNKSEVLGVFQKATAEQAQQAVEVAYKAFQSWRHEPVEKRVERMLKVARIMRQRKNELVAWCILE